MSVRRALLFSLLDRNASLIVGIASTMILARLLTPADIGVYSVTIALMSFVTAWRDFGAGQYLVQARELTPDRIRAVWTLQLSIGLALALLALAVSSPMARFYDEPRMREILWLLAASYAINPFGSLTYAWLMRAMRFEALAVMRLSGTLAGVIVSIVLAYRGMGPISLAWGNLVTVAVNAAASFAFRPADFPLLPGVSEIRRVLAFGTRMTSTSIIETACQAAPELVLGKLQGLVQVGLFSRANGLVAMFARLVSDAVNSVAMPMFAKAWREQGAVGPSFLKAHQYMTACAWSFAASVALLAHPLTLVLYGPQWTDSVPLVRWLAATVAVLAFASMCLQVLTGIGQAGLVLKATAIAGLQPARRLRRCISGAPPLWSRACWAACVGAPVWLYITYRTVDFDRVDPAWRGAQRRRGRGGCIGALPAGDVRLDFEHNLLVLLAGCVSAPAGVCRWHAGGRAPASGRAEGRGPASERPDEEHALLSGPPETVGRADPRARRRGLRRGASATAQPDRRIGIPGALMLHFESLFEPSPSLRAYPPAGGALRRQRTRGIACTTSSCARLWTKERAEFERRRAQMCGGRTARPRIDTELKLALRSEEGRPARLVACGPAHKQALRRPTSLQDLPG